MDRLLVGSCSTSKIHHPRSVKDKIKNHRKELKIQTKVRMGLHAMTAVFLLSYLCIPEEAMGGMSNSKTRLKEVERRHQIGRLPLSHDLLINGKEGLMAKRRQEQQFDDYGHMRFGKRGEGSEDYGHMRFGKRD